MPSVTSFRKAPPQTAATAQPAPAANAAAAAPAATPVRSFRPAAPAPVEQAAPAEQAVPDNVVEGQFSENAPAVQQGGQVVSDDFYAGLGGFEGEFSSSEMRTPYLSICGKTSKLFDEHPEFLGQFVFNKSISLGDEIRAVFIRATKWWVEDLPFGAEAIPQRFRTKAAARETGFSDNDLKDVADLDLLLELDIDIDGVAEMADLIVGDKGYMLARYSVQSTAYGRTVPILMSDFNAFLKGNFLNGFYTLSADRIEGKKGTYYAPKLKTDGVTPMDLRQAIVARVGASL